jgi:hypothetical protein
MVELNHLEVLTILIYSLEPNGDPIGPARVWLKKENIPGLAMSRSIGDLIAASVGVIEEPGKTKP